jgi:hypothetical protein
MRLGSTRRDLRADIEACGYFPDLVEDAVVLAVGEEDLLDFVVHHEPTFAHDEIHRHVTVLALTPTRLIVGHTDDQPAEPPATGIAAASSTESVALTKINTVTLTRVVSVTVLILVRQHGGHRDLALRRLGCRAPPGHGAGQLRGPAVRGRPRLHRHAGGRGPDGADERRGRRC